MAPEPEKPTKLANWYTLYATPKRSRDSWAFAVGGVDLFRILPVFLSHLLEKNSVDSKNFVCTVEAQEAFDKLKHSITSAPLLRHPDPDKQFVVTTDASDVGIGRTLLQRNEQDILYPIAYFSRVLCKSASIPVSKYDFNDSNNSISISNTSVTGPITYWFSIFI